SGVDNYEVTFDTGFNPQGSSNFTGSDGQVLEGITFGADGLQAVDGFFDADTGTIVLNDITPQGGRVSLTGTIVSTGAGEIRVASGFPSVKITNLTDFDLALGEIKADENRVGEIVINDTASLRREKYTVVDGEMTRVVEQGVLTTTDGLNSISYEEVSRDDGLSIDGTVTYQPEAGRFYGWVEGLGISEVKTEVFEDRAFWGLDWLAEDRASASTKVTPTDERPLLESEFVLSAEETKALFAFDYDANAEGLFLQKFQQAILDGGERILINEYEEGGGLFSAKVYVKVYETQVAKKNFYTYAMRADAPVKLVSLAGTGQPTVAIVNDNSRLLARGNLAFAAAPADQEGFVAPTTLSANALEMSGNATISGAMPEIRAASDLTLNISDPTGQLKAVVDGHLIIRQFEGAAAAPLRIGGIEAQGDVAILAHDSIIVTGAAQIKGEAIELRSSNGLIIGRIDGTSLSAMAKGSIEIIETDGDILLSSARYEQRDVAVLSLEDDVVLNAVNGSIVDGINDNNRPDNSAVQALMRQAALNTDVTLSSRADASMDPAVVDLLYPHRSTGGAGVAKEVANVQGKNIRLLAGSPGQSVGVVGGRTVIEMPSDVALLDEPTRLLLAALTVDDIVDIEYERYVYLGATPEADSDATSNSPDAAVVDLGEESTLLNTLEWRLVTDEDDSDLPVLSTLDGTTVVTPGQWVENKRVVKRITVSLVQDVDVKASGNVAVASGGDVALEQQGDLVIASLPISDVLSTTGIEGQGRVALVASGSISSQTASDEALVRTAGDLRLVARGENGSAGNVANSEGGALQVVMAEQSAILEGQAAGDFRLKEVLGAGETGASDLTLAGVYARGNIELQAQSGSILALDTVLAEERLHLSGDNVTLIAGDAALSTVGFRDIGAGQFGSRPLTVDVNSLSLASYTAGRPSLDVVDVNSLSLGANGLTVLNSALIDIRATQDLTVSDRVALQQDALGAVRLRAELGDLVLGGDLSFGLGAMSLSAGGDLRMENNAALTNFGGALDISVGGDWLQGSGMVRTAAANPENSGGALTVTVDGDAQLAVLDAGLAALSLKVGGDITVVDSVATHLTAQSLVLNVQGQIGRLGQNPQSLRVAADALSLNAGGAASLVSQTSLDVTSLTTGRTVDEIDFGADLVLVAEGDLRLAAVTLLGDGSLRLESQGAGNTLRLTEDIQAGAGVVSLASAGQIRLEDEVVLGTTGGALSLRSGGDLTFGEGASLVSGGGDMALLAGGAMILGALDAVDAVDATRAGNVLIASSEAMEQRTSAPALRAKDLSVLAEQGVSNLLRTDVERLALEVGQGDIHLAQAGNLIVTTLVNRVVREFSSSGLDAYSREAGASGLRTGETGALTLNVTGSLTLLADDAKDLGLILDIGTGGAEIIVTGALTLDGNIRVAGNVLMDVAGDLTQAEGRVLQAEGTVSVTVGGNAVLASVQAGALEAALAHTAAAAVYALNLTVGGDLSAQTGRAPVLVAGALGLLANTVTGTVRVGADSVTANITNSGLSLIDVDAAAGAAPGLDLVDVSVGGALTVESDGNVTATQVEAKAGSDVTLVSNWGDVIIQTLETLGGAGGALGALLFVAAGRARTTRTVEEASAELSTGVLVVDDAYASTRVSGGVLTVTTDGDLHLDNLSASGVTELVLQVGGAITGRLGAGSLTSVEIKAADSVHVLSEQTSVLTLAGVSAGAEGVPGDVRWRALGDVNLAGAVTTHGGAFQLDSAGAVALQAAVTADAIVLWGAALSATADGLLSARTVDLEAVTGDVGSRAQSLRVAANEGLSGRVAGSAFLQQEGDALAIAGLAAQELLALSDLKDVTTAWPRAVLAAQHLVLSGLGDLGAQDARLQLLAQDLSLDLTGGEAWLQALGDVDLVARDAEDPASVAVAGAGVALDLTAGGTLDVQADVATDAALRLEGQAVSLDAGVMMSTGGAAATLLAEGGDLTMGENALIDVSHATDPAQGGIADVQAWGRLAIAEVKAGAGVVRLISDVDALVAVGSPLANIAAEAVALQAGTAIGEDQASGGALRAPSNALTLAVNTLSAEAEGAVKLSSPSDSLTVDVSTALATAFADLPSTASLRSTGGGDVLLTANGLTVAKDALVSTVGDGVVTLDGTFSDLRIEGQVLAERGDVRLLASNQVTLVNATEAVDMREMIQTRGTVEVRAANGLAL
ncbi:MAG: hypothetical protein RLZZ174_487, partial [Pseudomonadota bacterium]